MFLSKLAYQIEILTAKRILNSTKYQMKFEANVIKSKIKPNSKIVSTVFRTYSCIAIKTENNMQIGRFWCVVLSTVVCIAQLQLFQIKTTFKQQKKIRGAILWNFKTFKLSLSNIKVETIKGIFQKLLLPQPSSKYLPEEILKYQDSKILFLALYFNKNSKNNDILEKILSDLQFQRQDLKNQSVTI